MNGTKLNISYYQFVLMIFGVQIGIGMLSLPHNLAEIAGTSSWISILFGGLISTLLSMFYIKLSQKVPHENFSSLITIYLGKFLGKICLLILLIYFLYAGYLVLMLSVLFVQAYLLQHTGAYVILFLFLIPTYQLITGGIPLIAKYIETIFPLVIFFLLMLFLTLKEPNFKNLFPIIKEGWLPILKAVPTTTMSFLGIEITFIIYPYLDKKEKAMNGVMIANAMSTFTYLFVTIISFVNASPYEILDIFTPVIAMLSAIEFQFLERMDVILLSLLFMVISKTWVTYFWAGLDGFNEIFKIKKFPLFVLTIFIIITICSYLFIPTFKGIHLQLKILSYTGLIVILGLPLILWIGGIVKKDKFRVTTK
ncbi:GerAB/ArcD/ProY family transporter [Gottfriedia sp. S16(2024)]|uniref:GerAB/ArcD/ProY family transporter n=1 Tax=Gottfriedia sp. S16(2024) TaxID=3162883 RepID=UPI003D215FDA